MARRGLANTEAFMNIWFIPTTITHVGRFRLLMEAFKERGDTVSFFCVDSAMIPSDRCLDQIVSSGYPYRELPAEVCDPQPHWALVRMNRRRLCAALREAWRGLAIDCLVIGSEYGYARRTIIRTAVQLGIPIVYLMDGLVVPPNPRYRPPILRRRKINIQLVFGLLRRLGVGDKEGNCGADLILLMNRTGCAQLIRNGAPSASVRVVGSPAHERLAASESFSLDDEQRQAIISKLNIPQSRPVVLYAAQSMDHKTPIHHMMPAVRQSGSVLLVKFHPRMADDVNEWRRWANEQGYTSEEIVFCRDELTSFDALRLCDVCVTVFSTVAIEAMILGKPVVYVQYLAGTFALDYASRYGAGIDAENPKDLQAAIEDLVHNETLRREIVDKGYVAAKDDLAGLDGKSLIRSVDEITALVARRQAG